MKKADSVFLFDEIPSDCEVIGALSLSPEATSLVVVCFPEEVLVFAPEGLPVLFFPEDDDLVGDVFDIVELLLFDLLVIV